MIEKGSVEIVIDLSEYIDVLSERAVGLIAADVRKFARELVRKDTKTLMDTIQLVKMPDGFMIFAETPYALAQEYGLAPFGKPNYGFTPYMGPAAAKASSDANILKCVYEAEVAAMQIATRKAGGTPARVKKITR